MLCESKQNVLQPKGSCCFESHISGKILNICHQMAACPPEKAGCHYKEGWDPHLNGQTLPFPLSSRKAMNTGASGPQRAESISGPLGKPLSSFLGGSRRKPEWRGVQPGNKPWLNAQSLSLWIFFFFSWRSEFGTVHDLPACVFIVARASGGPLWEQLVLCW